MEPNEWLHRDIFAQYIFRMLTFPQAHYYLRARSDKSKTTSRNRVFFSDHHQCIRLWNIFGVEFDEHHHSVFDWCEWFLLRLRYCMCVSELRAYYRKCIINDIRTAYKATVMYVKHSLFIYIETTLLLHVFCLFIHVCVFLRWFVVVVYVSQGHDYVPNSKY